MIKTYRELRRFETFEERFDYLIIGGVVGNTTYGFDRWINQRFYTSREWRSVRQDIIARDNGCDLGVEGYEIHSRLVIHHMNPMTTRNIDQDLDIVLNPEYLITTTHRTHNAIHFGDKSLLIQPHVDRVPGDTKLW